MYEELYDARAQPVYCSLDLLFSDVPVAVAVVAYFNSLNLCCTKLLLPSTLHFNMPSQEYEILVALRIQISV